MSYQQDKFKEIADAIRDKKGTSALIKPVDFAREIQTISGEVVLQDKSIEITENGVRTITADEGFDGLSSVEVTANVVADADWKDPEWWDIYNILAADETPGYIAKIIYLFTDEWAFIDLQGANAYRLSDGTFYKNMTPSSKTRHTWNESAYKPDSTGHRTKWLIRYWTSEIPSNLTLGPGANTVGAWPVYMVAKDSVISANVFPSSSYILKGYDHINCQYSGTSANAFFGGGNHLSLSHIPDDWVFTQPITSISTAFSYPLAEKIDYTVFDPGTILISTGAPTPNSSPACREIVGTVDLRGRTSNYTMSPNNLVEARFANIDCAFSISASSILSKATLESMKTALSDRTGKTALVLAVGENGRTMPPEWWDEIRAKNWTITGTFN